MLTMNKFVIVLLVAIIAVNCNGNEKERARGRIESCPGCQLNRLTDVKKFIFEDVPKYNNIEFKRIQGAPPELVLLNELDEETERIPLKTLTREECNMLLLQKGFRLKLAPHEDLIIDESFERVEKSNKEL